jgi:Zn-dependent M28 family amino/carboxypeptidase
VDPEQQSRAAPPRITLSDKSAVEFFAELKPGASGATATIHIAAPRETAVRLHNVIGILRGSDPALKDTCELLTAHYDHLGERLGGQGDRIYNGANDDGSGTVSVIEVARALSTLEPHPRRSILFIAFFGEEEGMIGSRYYARHPVWPLAKTIAQLNLEQVGRTDDSEGPQVSSATLTGFDYSNVAQYLQAAGELTRVKIYKHRRNSDLYFASGDNISLAEAGVVAHSLAVSFEFPDYHGVGDEWQKIDYANMAKVDRAVALALIMLASDDKPPHWNENNSRAAAFAKKQR